MKKLVLLLGLLATLNAFSQAVQFRKVYGGSSYDNGMDLVQLPDSGYLLLGTSSSFSESSDIYLLRVDKYGNFKWHHAYGGPGVEWGYSLKQTRDSGFVVAGYSNSLGNGGYDMYLLKVDSLGTKQWEKTYGGSDWEFGYSLDTTADGGFILTGSTLSFGKGNEDVYVVKTNALGDTLWTRTFGSTGEDVGRSVTQSRFDSTYAICGYTNGFGSPMHDVYLLHLKLNGDTIRTSHFGTQKEDFGRCVIFSNDSAFAVTGYTNGVLAMTDYDGLLWKLRKDMSQKWFEYAGQAGADEIMNDLWQRPDLDSAYVVCGETSYQNTDFAIYEIDKNGYFAFANTHGNSGVDRSYAFVHCSDGGFAQIGTTTSYTAQGLTLENILLIKSDSLFVNNNNAVLVVGIKEPALMAVTNSASPNPFITRTYIRSNVPFAAAAEENVVFSLFDITGKKVNDRIAVTYREADGALEIGIENKGLLPGMYTYRLGVGASASSGKLVITE